MTVTAVRRTAVRTAAAAAATGTLLVGAPLTAHATASSGVQTLQPGQEVCIGERADTAKVVTWASPNPARFRVYANGVLLFDAPNSFGVSKTFDSGPGLANYSVCGKNQNASTAPTSVYLQLN